MPDPSTSMMSSSSGDAGVTPFVVPDNPQQQSTLAKFLHGMAMTHLGLAGMEFQQQEQQKREHAQMLVKAVEDQPNLVSNEDFMKNLASVTSPNMANALGMWAHSADIQRKLAQKQLQGAFGDQQAGPPPSSGTPSELPATTISQGPSAAPESRLDYLRRVLPQREAIERHPAFAALPEGQQRAVSAQLRQMEEEMRALENKETPAAETQAQAERLDIEKQHLALDKQHLALEEKTAAKADEPKPAKPVDPIVEHKRQIDLIADADKTFKTDNPEPYHFQTSSHHDWQTRRAKALIKSGADPHLLGWKHGSSKTAGAGWVTSDGQFIADKDIGE